MPDLQNGPAVVAVTSLSPDHLDWHGRVERYYADKLSLCTKPGLTWPWRRRRRTPAPRPRSSVHTSFGGEHRPGAGHPLVGRSSLPGPHNARNASWRGPCSRPRHPRHNGRGSARQPLGLQPSPAGATRWARSVGSSSSTTAVDQRVAGSGGARAFGDVPWRSSSVATTGDSTTRRSAGPWPPAREPTLVVTMPDNGPRIGQSVRADTGGRVEVRDPSSLDAAVEAAFAWAPAGGVVLLSPAAPSFGHFTDYRERGGLRRGRRPLGDAR